MKNITKLLIILISLFLFSSTFSVKVNAACTGVRTNGNYTVSTSCAFADTIDGVDAGTGTQNTAVLTVAAGQTLTVNSGQSVAYGSMVINGTVLLNANKTAILTRAAITIPDNDGDGYPGSLTQSLIYPGQGTTNKRRNTMLTITATDCLDSGTGASSVYRNVASLYSDADMDTYTVGALGTQCVGASTANYPIAGRTSYVGVSGGYQWTSASTGTDCYDLSSNAKPSWLFYCC